MPRSALGTEVYEVIVNVCCLLAGRVGGHFTVTVRSRLFGTVVDFHGHGLVVAVLVDGSVVEHAQLVFTVAEETSDSADLGIGADQEVVSV
jgi:hypothetical protein